jgi:hypothetical protein
MSYAEERKGKIIEGQLCFSLILPESGRLLTERVFITPVLMRRVGKWVMRSSESGNLCSTTDVNHCDEQSEIMSNHFQSLSHQTSENER